MFEMSVKLKIQCVRFDRKHCFALVVFSWLPICFIEALSTRIRFLRKWYRFQSKRNRCIATKHRFRIVFILFSFRWRPFSKVIVFSCFRVDARWKRKEKFAISVKTIWKRIRADGRCNLYHTILWYYYAEAKKNDLWVMSPRVQVLQTLAWSFTKFFHWALNKFQLNWKENLFRDQ